MADIRITPASSIMAFTSSLNFKETLTQEASGSLTLLGSGSTGRTDLFTINGNNGTLFSVSDDLSNSLFSVNTIAGLPVIEAFADNTVVMGQYGQNVLVITGSRVGVGTSTPLQKIHIDDTAFIGDDINGGSGILIYGNPDSIINFNHEGTSTGYIQCGEGSNLYLDASSGRAIEFAIDGTTKMEVSPNGNVGIGTVGNVEPSAALEVKSNTQGFLLPRMDDGEMNAIAGPAIGLMVYNTSDDYVYVFGGASWAKLAYV